MPRRGIRAGPDRASIRHISASWAVLDARLACWAAVPKITSSRCTASRPSLQHCAGAVVVVRMFAPSFGRLGRDQGAALAGPLAGNPTNYPADHARSARPRACLAPPTPPTWHAFVTAQQRRPDLALRAWGSRSRSRSSSSYGLASVPQLCSPSLIRAPLRPAIILPRPPGLLDLSLVSFHLVCQAPDSQIPSSTFVPKLLHPPVPFLADLRLVPQFPLSSQSRSEASTPLQWPRSSRVRCPPTSSPMAARRRARGTTESSYPHLLPRTPYLCQLSRMVEQSVMGFWPDAQPLSRHQLACCCVISCCTTSYLAKFEHQLTFIPSQDPVSHGKSMLASDVLLDLPRPEHLRHIERQLHWGEKSQASTRGSSAAFPGIAIVSTICCSLGCKC